MTLYINGSPKAGESNSNLVIQMVQEELNEKHTMVHWAAKQETDWNRLAECQTIIMVFPLYVDSLPSHFLRFLMDFETFLVSRPHGPISVYGIAQCGFFDGVQNRHALGILECFCEKSGLGWMGGIGLGGAGALAGLPNSCKKAILRRIRQLAASVREGTVYGEDSFADIGMPRALYQMAGNFNWVREGKKNGLKKADLCRAVTVQDGDGSSS